MRVGPVLGWRIYYRYLTHGYVAEVRRYLGIEDSPGAQRFPLNNTEDMAFFG